MQRWSQPSSIDETSVAFADATRNVLNLNQGGTEFHLIKKNKNESHLVAVPSPPSSRIVAKQQAHSQRAIPSPPGSNKAI